MIRILLTFHPSVTSLPPPITTQRPLCFFQTVGVPSLAVPVARTELPQAFPMVDDFSSFSFQLKTISSERHSITIFLKLPLLFVYLRVRTLANSLYTIISSINHVFSTIYWMDKIIHYAYRTHFFTSIFTHIGPPPRKLLLHFYQSMSAIYSVTQLKIHIIKKCFLTSLITL